MDIEMINNEDLLDALIYAYGEMGDYVYRQDHVEWSQESEQNAVNKYNNLKEETLERMNLIEKINRTSDGKVPLVQFMSEETLYDIKDELKQTSKNTFVSDDEFEVIRKENKGIIGKYEGRPYYVIIDNDLPRGTVVSID